MLSLLDKTIGRLRSIRRKLELGQITPESLDSLRPLLLSFQLDKLEREVDKSLDELPIRDLYEIAKRCRMKYYTTFSKSQLVEAIRDTLGNTDYKEILYATKTSLLEFFDDSDTLGGSDEGLPDLSGFVYE